MNRSILVRRDIRRICVKTFSLLIKRFEMA